MSTNQSTKFSPIRMAKWYAKHHSDTDAGVREVWYLPKDAPERDIRLLEVNDAIVERVDGTQEPVDFGVDQGMDSEHLLVILDITPAQWKKVQSGKSPLPSGWSLEGAIRCYPK